MNYLTSNPPPLSPDDELSTLANGTNINFPFNIPFTNQSAFQSAFTPEGFSFDSPFGGLTGTNDQSHRHQQQSQQQQQPSSQTYDAAGSIAGPSRYGGMTGMRAAMGLSVDNHDHNHNHVNMNGGTDTNGADILDTAAIPSPSTVNLVTGSRFSQLLEAKLGLNPSSSPLPKVVDDSSTNRSPWHTPYLPPSSNMGNTIVEINLQDFNNTPIQQQSEFMTPPFPVASYLQHDVMKGQYPFPPSEPAPAPQPVLPPSNPMTAFPMLPGPPNMTPGTSFDPYTQQSPWTAQANSTPVPASSNQRLPSIRPHHAPDPTYGLMYPRGTRPGVDQTDSSFNVIARNGYTSDLPPPLRIHHHGATHSRSSPSSSSNNHHVYRPQSLQYPDPVPGNASRTERDDGGTNGGTGSGGGGGGAWAMELLKGYKSAQAGLNWNMTGLDSAPGPTSTSGPVPAPVNTQTHRPDRVDAHDPNQSIRQSPHQHPPPHTYQPPPQQDSAPVPMSFSPSVSVPPPTQSRSTSQASGSRHPSPSKPSKPTKTPKKSPAKPKRSAERSAESRDAKPSSKGGNVIIRLPSPVFNADGTIGDDPGEKKLVIACHTCRARKLKCDGVRPKCYNCVRRNEPACEYDNFLRRRGPGRNNKRDRRPRGGGGPGGTAGRGGARATGGGRGRGRRKTGSRDGDAGEAGGSVVPEEGDDDSAVQTTSNGRRLSSTSGSVSPRSRSRSRSSDMDGLDDSAAAAGAGAGHYDREGDWTIQTESEHGGSTEPPGSIPAATGATPTSRNGISHWEHMMFGSVPSQHVIGTSAGPGGTVRSGP